jgi:hypothetical protein
MNLNRDLLIALRWQSTYEREFGIQIGDFLTLSSRVKWKTKFEFLSVCVEFD